MRRVVAVGFGDLDDDYLERDDVMQQPQYEHPAESVY
jgi:hypothetical protein